MNDISTHPIAVTAPTFGDRVLRADTPVLVDFRAEWCAPCRALGPVVASLAQEYAGRASVAKVDIDANPDLAGQFGIRSIPTVMLFDKGQVVDSFVGVGSRGDYAQAIDKSL